MECPAASDKRCNPTMYPVITGKESCSIIATRTELDMPDSRSKIARCRPGPRGLKKPLLFKLAQRGLHSFIVHAQFILQPGDAGNEPGQPPLAQLPPQGFQTGPDKRKIIQTEIL